MTKPFTIKTPRYHIMGKGGEHFDVFNQKKNAIKAAVKMAMEYPGFTFQVIKKVNYKSTCVFSFGINLQMSLEDIKTFHESVSEVSSNKLKKVRFWRLEK